MPVRSVEVAQQRSGFLRPGDQRLDLRMLRQVAGLIHPHRAKARAEGHVLRPGERYAAEQQYAVLHECLANDGEILVAERFGDVNAGDFGAHCI